MGIIRKQQIQDDKEVTVVLFQGIAHYAHTAKQCEVLLRLGLPEFTWHDNIVGLGQTHYKLRLVESSSHDLYTQKN